MKVLLVNDYATPTAGAEIMAVTLRDELRARGHEVRVLASTAELVKGPQFADEVCFGTTSRFQTLTSVYNLSARRAIARIISGFNPDLVHVKMFLWQISPSILPVLRRIPAVYQIETYKPICPNGRKTLPNGKVCESTAGKACMLGGCLTPQSWIATMTQHILWRRNQGAFDQFVTISQTMRERLESEGVGPCEVIPNGCPVRSARPALSDEPVIAFAGRLSSEKGVGVLIEAFANARRQVPRAKLWIAGDGPQAADLKRLAQGLGVADHTQFLGSLNREQLEKQFDAAWIQAVPSIWDEPFGIVAIEAMMRGTTVVASNSGGLREIVQHEQTGLLVPRSDVQQLSAALVRLASDRALCETMGAAGRAIALEKFTIGDCCDRLLALYAKTVSI